MPRSQKSWNTVKKSGLEPAASMYIYCQLLADLYNIWGPGTNTLWNNTAQAFDNHDKASDENFDNRLSVLCALNVPRTGTPSGDFNRQRTSERLKRRRKSNWFAALEQSDKKKKKHATEKRRSLPDLIHWAAVNCIRHNPHCLLLVHELALGEKVNNSREDVCIQNSLKWTEKRTRLKKQITSCSGRTSWILSPPDPLSHFFLQLRSFLCTCRNQALYALQG